MKKFYLIFSFFMMTNTYASHIIGGDIYYDYLGNNQYRFFITLYRDCNSSGAQYDDPLALTIYKPNNVFFANILVPFAVGQISRIYCSLMIQALHLPLMSQVLTLDSPRIVARGLPIIHQYYYVIMMSSYLITSLQTRMETFLHTP